MKSRTSSRLGVRPLQSPVQCFKISMPLLKYLVLLHTCQLGPDGAWRIPLPSCHAQYIVAASSSCLG